MMCLKRKIFLVLFLTVVLTAGFSAGKGYAGLPGKETTPAPVVMQSVQEEATPLSGKVVETMDSGGYTYVMIEKTGRKTWVAVQQTQVKVGEEVSFQPGHKMNNFTSKTLDRTFEVIYFSPGLVQEMNETVTVDENISGKVVETMDSGGYTYIRIEKDNIETWVAVPETKVTTGKDVAFKPGNKMTDFSSKTLDRTFKTIYFSPGLVTTSPETVPPDKNISGTVEEVLEGEDYTYALIRKDGKKTWIAVLRENLDIGAKVSFRALTVMKNFHSKTFNRTFDAVVFVSPAKETDKSGLKK